MSEERKCFNNEELCGDKKELSQEEMEQVTGGAAAAGVKADDIAKVNTTDAMAAMAGKAQGVQIIAIQTLQASGMEFKLR